MPLVWFVSDPLGICFIVLTWVLMAFGDWVVIKYTFHGWFASDDPMLPGIPFDIVGTILFFFYQALLVFAVLAHLQAIFCDPGSPNKYPRLAPFPLSHGPQARICHKCNNHWKPPRAHHCKTCKMCIFRMDHHCPWINNCVGLYNQKMFILFLFYTALFSLSSVLLLMLGAFWWFRHSKNPASEWALAFGCFAALEGVFFLFFTLDFLSEQIEAIDSNSTLVETYKRTHGRQRTFLLHLTEVFGRNWVMWPFPIPADIKPQFDEPAIPDGQDERFLEMYGPQPLPDIIPQAETDMAADGNNNINGPVGNHHPNNPHSHPPPQCEPAESSTAIGGYRYGSSEDSISGSGGSEGPSPMNGGGHRRHRTARDNEGEGEGEGDEEYDNGEEEEEEDEEELEDSVDGEEGRSGRYNLRYSDDDPDNHDDHRGGEGGGQGHGRGRGGDGDGHDANTSGIRQRRRGQGGGDDGSSRGQHTHAQSHSHSSSRRLYPSLNGPPVSMARVPLPNQHGDKARTATGAMNNPYDHRLPAADSYSRPRSADLPLLDRDDDEGFVPSPSRSGASVIDTDRVYIKREPVDPDDETEPDMVDRRPIAEASQLYGGAAGRRRHDASEADDDDYTDGGTLKSVKKIKEEPMDDDLMTYRAINGRLEEESRD